MNLDIIQHFLTKNDCYITGRPLYVKGITVHSTGANNPNIPRYVDYGIGYSSNHWNKPGLEKCVHAFVGKYMGKLAIVQTLPWNMQGWHCGKGKLGSANQTTIGFEICEDSLTDNEYFSKAMDKAQQLCAFLCQKFDMDPLEDGVIMSHHERNLQGYASNHGDIDHWLKIYGKNMNWFRECVANILKEGAPVTQADFDRMMEDWLKRQAALPYSKWAETAHIKDRAVDAGITADGSEPKRPATREEVFSMILNAFKKEGGNHNG